MSWRDVPMPTGVAALPTDKRGFPVPWVSCWDSEENKREAVSTATLDLGGLVIQNLPVADCDHVAGRGIPDLGSLCPGNQIKGMLDRLCDVCGDFIPPGPIYFMGAYDLLGGAIGFRECGCHYECAMYAAQVCPGLIVPKASKVVGVFETLAYTVQPEFMYSPDGQSLESRRFLAFDDPDLIALLAANRRMVLMGVYARPINPTITRLNDWVAAQPRSNA